MLFDDRIDAGRKLAAKLTHYRNEDPLVLGLPRGGVPVAFEVARALGAPLDVWVVRKIGAPGQPELGIGAVSEGGAVFLDHKIADAVGATKADIESIEARERAEVERRVRRFRFNRPAPDVRGRTVIVVDDGVATGGTVRAVLLSIRRLTPRRLVLAVPVGAQDSVEELRAEVDDLVCLEERPDLCSIGAFYWNFTPIEDEEVVALLERARSEGQERPKAQRVASAGKGR
jgi:putative phosphoribosyl transferase